MIEVRNRRPGELAFGVLLIAFSLFVLAKAYAIAGLASPSSAGVFPMLAAAAMLVSALVIAARTARMPAGDDASGEGGGRGFVHEIVPRDLVVFTAMVVAYMLALQPLGFLISSFAFLLAAIGYLYRGGIVRTLAISTAALVAVWFVFRVVFEVVLPQGDIFR